MAGRSYALSLPTPGPDGYNTVYFLPIAEEMSIEIQVLTTDGTKITSVLQLHVSAFV